MSYKEPCPGSKCEKALVCMRRPLLFQKPVDTCTCCQFISFSCKDVGEHHWNLDLYLTRKFHKNFSSGFEPDS